MKQTARLKNNVDVAMGVCECPIGETGRMCKLQRSLIVNCNVKSGRICQQTAREKHFYAIVALGDQAPTQISFSSRQRNE